MKTSLGVFLGFLSALLLLLPKCALSEGALTIPQRIEVAFPNAPVMYYVAMAESGLVPTAKNPDSSAKGLFQVLDGTWKYFHCTGNPLNADDNIACAQIIYAHDGTLDWLASKPIWTRLAEKSLGL